MRTISYDKYYDKVLGGWTGKCLGGTVGFFEGTKEITNLNINDLLPEKAPPNDDLDIQLVWLDVLLEYGIYFTSDQLMEAWIKKYPCNFGEYATGRRNYRRGLHAPACGSYTNVFFASSMGCPIRSEVWGMIAPGSADLAARYAEKDGTLDHPVYPSGESVCAEQFLSAIESEAFFESDLEKLIDFGLRFVPKDSKLYRCIEIARNGFHRGIDWRQTWRELRNDYGSPDCTSMPISLGITVLALLHGGGDLEKTLDITANAGWDVDCTCSTSAALLGIITGCRCFPGKWLDYIGDSVVTMAAPSHRMDSLKLLAEYTCRTAAALQNEKALDVKITDMPDYIKPVPSVRYKTDAVLTVDYMGFPCVSANIPKPIMLKIKNNTSGILSGTLKIGTSDYITALQREFTISIAPQSEDSVGIVIKANGCGSLPDTNLITAAFENYGTLTFGLCGAPAAMVSKIYSDSYMDWLSPSDVSPSRLLKSGGSVVIIPEAPEEWGNHRVDIDKKYIPEDFSSPERIREQISGGRITAIEEDRYIIKDVYGYEGPACVYFYEELFCPVDREGTAFCGSSDPFKIWINGTEVLSQNGCRWWYPNHYAEPISFKKGLNTLVIKITRFGADNRLNLAFRHKPTIPGFDSAPYMTDLAYGTFKGENK
ncbi:MAG: ADP-ribosylglycohydrolase family protein [Eubacteriales bacterium]